MISKILLLSLFTLSFFFHVIAQQVVLRGVLLDSTFIDSDSITAEILENGETYTIKYGKPFEFVLKGDESWNFCVRDSRYEQCYLIVRGENSDSIIVDTLTNENILSVYTSFVNKVDYRDTLVSDTNISERADTAQISQTTDEILTRLRPVVIQVRKRPRRTLGQSTVSSKAIARQPGLAEADVLKAIQALPGVVASSDFSSKIYVRGGGADQNLFLFDNGVVYSPVHFFGLFSTFLVDGIEKVDFYKGGFSPIYGNRLSSVVAITSRKGGSDTTDQMIVKGSAQVSTFATTLSVEASKGPLQLNFSGRSTYLKEVLAGLKSIGATDLALDYRFYDIQGNASWRLNDDQSLVVGIYSGKDDLILSPIKTFWGNRVIPINYVWDINDIWALKSTLSYSFFEQEFGIESIQKFTNSITSLSLKPVLEFSGLSSQRISFGVESQHFKTSFGNVSESINNQSLNSFYLISPFIEDRISSGKVDIVPAIRLNYLSSLNKYYTEPRISLSFNKSEDQRFDFHVGQYKQYVNSVQFSDFESLNEFYYPSAKEVTQDIPPSSSVLFSFGYSHENIAKLYDFIFEMYYKTLDDLIVFDPNSKPDSISDELNPSLGDFFITGEGYSLGTELSLRKNSGLIAGGVSYAFGYSVQKEVDRIFRAKWEIPHSLKLDGGITWRDPNSNALWKSKKNYLQSSFQFKYNSGLPLTEVSGHLPTHYIDQGEGDLPGGPTSSLDKNTATPLGGRNRSRYPSYSRFDIKLIDWGNRNKWDFGWTLLNVFNTENVFLYTYDNSVNPPKRTTIAQFPFFPVLLSYKRYF